MKNKAAQELVKLSVSKRKQGMSPKAYRKHFQDMAIKRWRGDKVAAVVTIYNANEMSDKGRQEIAKWLKQNAAWLAEHGKDLSKTFTTRYLYK